MRGNPKASVRRTIACCALGLLAGGCVGQPVYHESWAARSMAVAADGCPDVDGVFENAGDGYKRESRDRIEKHNTSLAHMLNGGFAMDTHTTADRLGVTSYEAATDPYQAVSLRREGEFLQVGGIQDGQVVRSFRLPVKVPCRDALLVVESAIAYDLFMAAFARGYYALGRAEDGALLAYGSVGGVMLGALWSSQSFWVRFPETAPDAEAVAEAAAPAVH